MKLLGMALLLISGFEASAAEQFYNLKMKLALNGKHVSSPSVVVKDGEKATVTHNEKTFIEILTTEQVAGNSKGIMMSFIIGTMGEKGERTILAQPRILAVENETAQVTISDGQDGPEQVSLSVLATKTNYTE